MNDEHRVVNKQLNTNKHLNKSITMICNLEAYKYSHPSVSARGLVPGPPQTPESTDVQVPYVKWRSICL